MNDWVAGEEGIKIAGGKWHDPSFSCSEHSLPLVIRHAAGCKAPDGYAE